MDSQKIEVFILVRCGANRTAGANIGQEAEWCKALRHLESTLSNWAVITKVTDSQCLEFVRGQPKLQ